MDARTLAVYFAEFRHDFHQFAARRVGEDLAEDAMQETYVRLHELFPHYQDRFGRRGAFGWMLQVLRRVCLEQRRGTAATALTLGAGVGIELAEARPDGCDVEGEIVARLEREEQAATIRRLIEEARLPGLQRAAVLAVLDGEETAATARRLAMTEANVRAHLSCALSRLRALNGADDDEDLIV